MLKTMIVFHVLCLHLFAAAQTTAVGPVDPIQEELKKRNYTKALPMISKELRKQLPARDPNCLKFECRRLFEKEREIIAKILDPKLISLAEEDMTIYLEQVKEPQKRWDIYRYHGDEIASALFSTGLYDKGVKFSKLMISRMTSLDVSVPEKEADMAVLRYQHELARYQRILGLYPAAKDAIRTGLASPVLERVPERHFWLNVEGADLEVYLGNYAGTEKYFEQAAVLAKSPNAWINMGWINILKSHSARSQGQLAQAETDARSAVELAAKRPEYPALKVWSAQALSMALRRQGKLTEALAIAQAYETDANKYFLPGDAFRSWPLYELHAIRALEKSPAEVKKYRDRINVVLKDRDLAVLYKDFLDFWEHLAKGNSAQAKQARENVLKRYGKFQPDYLDLAAIELK